MTTETPAPQTALRPVSGNPDVHHSYADDDWDLETPIDPRVGWSLSYGCKVTVGFDGDDLHVTVSTCDRDQRDGITKRGVTREQVADYARKLAALVGVDASEVARLRAEVERLTAENAELRHALSVAEQHEADVRLEVERDLRDEAAKAGV